MFEAVDEDTAQATLAAAWAGGASHLDVVYVHDLGSDHLGPAWEQYVDGARDGCSRALRELRDQGAITAWGLGNNVVDAPIRALREADPDVIQISGRYTLLDQSALDELLPLCAEKDVAVVVGGVYDSGVLAGGRRHDCRPADWGVRTRRDRITGLCAAHGVDPRAAALQFTAAHPVVTTIIPGTKHPERAALNARLLTDPIPNELWQDLRDAALIRPDAPTPP